MVPEEDLANPINSLADQLYWPLGVFDRTRFCTRGTELCEDAMPDRRQLQQDFSDRHERLADRLDRRQSRPRSRSLIAVQPPLMACRSFRFGLLQDLAAPLAKALTTRDDRLSRWPG